MYTPSDLRHSSDPPNIIIIVTGDTKFMAQRENVPCKTGFSNIKIFKDHILGVGSYGKVCKAKCDGLLCAAKIIHETLLPQLEPTRQHQFPCLSQYQQVMKRFRQECQFMSAINHPNIVQFLGMYEDPDSRLPVLLMELMDVSLTKFLEYKETQILYHIQVNICHDVTLALSFLHSNKIIHRDLSSNNILLMSNFRAKVADFGMASLVLTTDGASHTLRHTTCPGTDHYMPPEAVDESDTSQYTEKLDCFSFGVIIIQLLTQEFPQPTRRYFTVTSEIKIRVSEVDRRANHIRCIDKTHFLLPIALVCLNDAPDERPTAKQLCDRVASLKENPMYEKSIKTERRQLKFDVDGDESKRNTYSRSHCEDCLSYKGSLEEKDLLISNKNRTISRVNEILTKTNQRVQEQNQEIQQLKQRNKQVQQEKQEIIQRFEKQVREMDREIHERGKKNQHLQRRLDQVIIEKDQLSQKLIVNEEVTAQLQQRIDELDNDLAQERTIEKRLKQQEQECYKQRCTLQNEFELKQAQKKPQTPATSQETNKRKFNLRWKRIENAPCKMIRCCDAALHYQGSVVTVYIRSGDTNKIYSYNTSAKEWSQLPSCPNKDCSLIVLNGLLTTVGGYQNAFSDELFSLSMQGKERRWTRQFPNMPTKRSGTTALWNGTVLVVAGGEGADDTKLHSIVPLKTVEIMKGSTCFNWSTAASLPEPLQYASGTLCDSHIYIVGGVRDLLAKKSAYVCSLDALLSSCQQRLFGVWDSIRMPTLPMAYSTCISLNGRVVLIGGKDEVINAPTTAIHMYNPCNKSWETISHMTSRRSDCFAVVLPNDQQILVFGGKIDKYNFTDSVELATVTVE